VNNTTKDLLDIATRHQIHLERLKTQNVNESMAFLKEIDAAIAKQLANRDITAFKRDRLEALVVAVRDDLKDIGQRLTEAVIAQAVALGVYESGFEIKSLSQVIEAEFKKPSKTQLRSALLTNPLSVEGADKGKLLKAFISDTNATQLRAVENALRSGYYQGLTTQEVVRNIRGTKAAGFKDGILARVGNSINAVTRTALQHSAVQAREETWDANADIVKSVQWASVLDSRTSPQCRHLDGMEFGLREGPRPPIHINCRSTMIAVLDPKFKSLSEGRTRFSRSEDGIEYVPASQNYYDWLKNQPAAFQDSAIGSTRGKLFRNGGLSKERFSELQLNKNFEPVTLKQMRALEPAAFERAGI
jgi:SPP1 gp7 family putative phage head morphogenesis protein